MPILKGPRQDSEFECVQIPLPSLMYSYSKLEEVTSELSNLKDAIRSNGIPHNLRTGHDTQDNSQSFLPPEGGFSVPSVPRRNGRLSCDVSSIDFYGIDDIRNDEFHLAEQHLGDVHLTAMAIVDLFEQYKTNLILPSISGLTMEQFPTTLLSARSGPRHFFNVA
jgi:hypothetical protein